MHPIDLVMIVRDEARCLARCLRSVRPWVDRMVVLDTGSSDDTVRIALDEGAEVFHFEWCDDFAAARNAALAHATAPWRLVLDADEWLIEGGQALCQAIETVRPGQVDGSWVGVVSVESAFAQGAGEGVGVTRITRLLPRGVTYAGRIHEQPQHHFPRIALPMRIGHDGYMPAVRQRKLDRNEHLLQRALMDTPSNAYLLYQWGKDAEVAERWLDAVGRYQQADAAVTGPAPWQRDLMVRWLHCLSMVGAHEPAAQLAGERCDAWSGSTDFHFVVGTLMMNWACAQPERAAECLAIAQASWERCLALGDQPGEEGTVLGRGSDLAAWNLMALHTALRHKGEADRYRAMAEDMRRSVRSVRGRAPPASSQAAGRSICTRDRRSGHPLWALP